MYINEKGEITNRSLYDKSFQLYISLIAMYIFDIVCLIYASVKLDKEIKYICIFLSIIVLFILVILTKMYLVKYKITEEGLWIKYPLESSKLLYWKDFQQICICYSSRNSVGVYVLICFVKHGEKKSFSNGRWKVDSLFHYRSVITMDYTFALYKSIKKMCPYDIVDLRETTNYKRFT